MQRKPFGSAPVVGIISLVAGVLAANAFFVRRSTRATERAHPAQGRFVEVQGVKLHYIERGAGPPIVLLHGNGVNALDWEVSGVLEGLAAGHRVIAFDRPGFGYSERPRDTNWTPTRQAELLHAAFAQLGIERPAVVAHSWGTLVALALALDHPVDVERLVLVSGYYFPSLRLEVPLAGVAAIPLIGDVLRNTISPVVGRLMSPLLTRQLFGPAPIPERFAQFPLALSLRPSQLRASAQETLLMVPSAAALAARYEELKLPVSIVAGSGDLIVNPVAQSNRLARLIHGDNCELVSGAGHMVHYFAPELVIAAAAKR